MPDGSSFPVPSLTTLDAALPRKVTEPRRGSRAGEGALRTLGLRLVRRRAGTAFMGDSLWVLNPTRRELYVARDSSARAIADFIARMAPEAA